MPESLNTRPLSPTEARLKNPLALAFIGDTVWDLLIRRQLLDSGAHVNALHRQAVARVNAGAQARVADLLLPSLTEEEEAVFRRGLNAHARHAVPKNQDPVDYSKATALEALLGYLYLIGDAGRILTLFQMINDVD